MTDPTPLVPIPLPDLSSLAARLEAEKEYALADRLLARALAVAPDHPDILHLFGVVAFRLGRREEALASMEKAIARGSDIRLYLRNISEVYRALGHPSRPWPPPSVPRRACPQRSGLLAQSRGHSVPPTGAG